MLKTFCLAIVLLSAFCLPAQDLFQASDFTAENLFSNNIEGPAFDKHGNLYVVM